MTAAEKLKALEAVLTDPDLRWGNGALARLHDALPQIVAVVEAAEQREAVHVLNEGSESGMASLLRALDEALGEQA